MISETGLKRLSTSIQFRNEKNKYENIILKSRRFFLLLFVFNLLLGLLGVSVNLFFLTAEMLSEI